MFLNIYEGLVTFTLYFCVARCLTVIDNNGCVTLQNVVHTKGADFNIVGLYPIHGHTSTNAFRYNHNGLIWSEATKYYIDEINRSDKLLKGVRLGYVIYDTCSELYLALPSILEISLDADMITGNKKTISTRRECLCYNNSVTSYIGVVGDAASSMSKKVSALLSVSNMPQISYSSTSIELSNKETYPSFLRTIPSDDFQVKLIVAVVRHFNWSYVSVVASDDAYGRIGVQQLVPALKRIKGMCLAAEEIFNTDIEDRTEINDIVQRIKEIELSTVIILWAQQQHAKAFLEQASIHKLYGRIWIGTESWGHHASMLEFDPNIINGLLAVAPYSGSFPVYKKHFSEITRASYNDSPWIKHYFELREEQENGTFTKNFGQIIDEFSFSKIGFVGDAVYAFAYSLQNYITARNQSIEDFKHTMLYSEYLEFVRNVSFDGFLGNQATFNKNGDVNDATYHLLKVQPKEGTGKLAFHWYGYWNDTSFVEKPGNWVWFSNSTIPPVSKCSDICTEGLYDTELGSKCCWKCIPCPDGFFKDSIGNDKNCTRCPFMTISSKNRSSCIVLSKVFFQRGELLVTLLLFFSIVGAMVTFCMLLLFIRHRKTPVVKSSNFKMSVLQLTCQTLLFLTPILYVGEPTDAICVYRPALPALFLTSIVTITLIKTEYLLRIFRRTTLLTSKIIALSKTIEMASLCFVLLLQVTFIVVLNIYQPSEFIRLVSKEKSEVVLTCNISFHFSGEIIFVLILSVACLVQAFRAKSLPANYNEAKRITYAMLCLSLCLLLSMLFFVSISDIEGKYFATCLLINIGNFALIFWMYAYKVVIILFFKNENTRAKFNTDRMSFVQSEISKRSSKVHPEPLSIHRNSSGKPSVCENETISGASTKITLSGRDKLLPDRQRKSTVTFQIPDLTAVD